MKARSIRVTVALAALALVAGACSSDGSGKKAAQTLRITSPATGAASRGNVVSLALGVGGISLVKADGNTSGRTGHLHVFIDRDPVAPGQVIPKEAGIVHSADNPVKLTGLSVGRHRLVVVLGDGAHRRIGSVASEPTLVVEGPSVDASSPATVPAGQPVVLTVKVAGVTLSKAHGCPNWQT